jgi:uridine kinase
METRKAVLDQLTDLILSASRPYPTRVAIDGRGGAGKSTLADELADAVRLTGRTVIRAEVDHFYRLDVDQSNRRQLTAASFYDAYDYAALQTLLLDPLGPGGSRRYRTRWHDGWNPGVIDDPELVAPDDAVLIVDGVYLLRPELSNVWDVRIYVSVEPQVGLARGVERDLLHARPTDVAAHRQRGIRVWRERYLPADDAYARSVQPLHLADAVLDNNDLSAPTLRLRA